MLVIAISLKPASSKRDCPNLKQVMISRWSISLSGPLSKHWLYLKDLYALRVKITEEKRHPSIFSPNKKELGITCRFCHLRACFCHTQLGINPSNNNKDMSILFVTTRCVEVNTFIQSLIVLKPFFYQFC